MAHDQLLAALAPLDRSRAIPASLLMLSAEIAGRIGGRIMASRGDVTMPDEG